MQSVSCFHCELPLSKNVFYVTIAGKEEPMCCIGCQQVAQTIIDNNLITYYQFRDKASLTQKTLIPAELIELTQYNTAAIQDNYLITKTDNSREVVLSIDGIVCAACVWLLEKHVANMKGVSRFVVNLTTHRAQLCWDDHQIKLSDILFAITKIGYRAEPFRIDHAESKRQAEQRAALKRLAISGLGFGQVMMFAAPLYSWFSLGIPTHYRDFFRIVSLVVTTPVLVYCCQPFFKSAWNSLKSRWYSMDVSISLALITVFVAGVYATIAGSGEVYFDSITMFVFFITLSRYLEMRARHQASLIASQLSQQAPIWITRILPAHEEVIPISQVRCDDLISIKAGSTIPVDGVIISGMSSVSETLLTGEAMPKLKNVNQAVVAGSQNIDNPLVVRVTRVGEQTTLATIMRLFERAQFDKPSIVTLSQRFSHYFIITQLIIAASLFIYWLPYSVSNAFWVTISILVISCPCALALATPIALTASMNMLSKRGFLCTRGHVLESLVNPTDYVFDKTGTLTEGKFSIRDVHLHSSLDNNSILSIAAALESKSEHPIASAFKSIKFDLQSECVVIHPNQGITGIVDGKQYYMGSLDFIKSVLGCVDVSITINQYTQVVLADQGRILAVFDLEDRLRPHASDLIRYLQSCGYRTHILSGDTERTVAEYARLLNVDCYQSNCTPQFKLEYVKQLQSNGGTVVTIGDGINDAPVLMQSQVSIAMANAADISRINADALLLTDDLLVIKSVIIQVQRTHRIIKQGLIWAVIYNILTLPFAVMGVVAPYVAAALMSVSSIFVVLNALRLMNE